jgi:hypothetical protein
MNNHLRIDPHLTNPVRRPAHRTVSPRGVLWTTVSAYRLAQSKGESIENCNPAEAFHSTSLREEHAPRVFHVVHSARLIPVSSSKTTPKLKGSDGIAFEC